MVFGKQPFIWWWWLKILEQNFLSKIKYLITLLIHYLIWNYILGIFICLYKIFLPMAESMHVEILFLKAWLMCSSFRQIHRRIPSVTQFPFSVVICLSIHHCHINFWKQGRYGNRKRIFSSKIPLWCSKTRFVRNRRIRNKIRTRVLHTPSTGIKFLLKYATICLTLIYRSLGYRSERRRPFLLMLFKLTDGCFCMKGDISCGH